MAKNYDDLATGIIAGVGGTSNVDSLVHCATRLRFTLKDDGKADVAGLKQLGGVINVLQAGGQTQVVIGNEVPEVYAAVAQRGGIAEPGSGDGSTGGGGGSRRNVAAAFVDMISSIFAPVLAAMAGAGILKGLLILATTMDWTTDTSGTYTILYAAADGVFYFLPLMLAVTAARKFKADQFVAMGLGAALVYPTLVAAYSAGTDLEFLGIPVQLASYTSSVIPIIAAVYVLSKLGRVLRRALPDFAKNFLTPLIELAVMVPATLLVIGPITTWLGSTLASGYTSLVGFNPTVAGFILGGLWPVFVLFGLHYGFVPIVFNNIAQYGKDTLFVITGPNNMAQAGSTFGVFLKTRNKDLKALSGAAGLSAVFAGITEPAIYGVTLKYKRPFIIGACFSAIAGAIVANAGTGTPALVGTAILTLPAYIGQGFVAFLIACAIAFFGSAVVTYFFGFNDRMIPADASTSAAVPVGDRQVLVSPVSGELVPLPEVGDALFASGDLGTGIAVRPTDGRVVAPADGTITSVFPTRHAFGLRTPDGTEVLVHIGFNTVQLGGTHFSSTVRDGQQVHAGDTVITVDVAAVQAAGYDPTTVLLVTGEHAQQVDPVALTGTVVAGRDVVLRPVAEVVPQGVA
ncbi:MAG TPA: beta-glucoside-specific PTS transporter subunit IIABC [Cellulomonas sp.]